MERADRRCERPAASTADCRGGPARRMRLAPALLLLGLMLGPLGCGGGNTTVGLPLGADCADEEAEACQSGLCLRLDDASAYCTITCDKVAQDCPAGYLCRTTGNPVGDHCVKVTGDGPCASDADCPSGHRCDTSAGEGEGICYVPVSRGLCAPCTSSQQCPEGGGCFQTATGEQFCTAPCEGGCPDGYSCQDLPGLGQQCAPERGTCNAGKPVCAPCRGDSECGGFLDLCVQNLVSGERFCGRDCAGDPSVCPTGFGCVDLSGEGRGPYQCVPNSATCEGYCDAPADDLAAAEAQCGFGRMCDAETNTCIPADDGRLCAPCADDDDCQRGAGSVNSLCLVNVGNGETFCGRDCSSSGCPAGFACIDVEAAGQMHKQCVPVRGSCVAGTGRLGDDCSGAGADDCLTGICLEFGRVSLCSAACSTDAECNSAGGADYACCALSMDGTAFDCTRAPAAGESGVCAPQGGRFGDDCSPGQPPCRSGLCLDIGTARLCSEACMADGDCPEGFRCASGQDTETGETLSICFPDGGGVMGSDCSFGPAACESRLCLKSGGVQFCTVPCDENGGCPEDWVCDPEAHTVDDRLIAVCVPPQYAP